MRALEMFELDARKAPQNVIPRTNHFPFDINGITYPTLNSAIVDHGVRESLCAMIKKYTYITRLAGLWPVHYDPLFMQTLIPLTAIYRFDQNSSNDINVEMIGSLRTKIAHAEKMLATRESEIDKLRNEVSRMHQEYQPPVDNMITRSGHIPINIRRELKSLYDRDAPADTIRLKTVQHATTNTLTSMIDLDNLHSELQSAKSLIVKLESNDAEMQKTSSEHIGRIANLEAAVTDAQQKYQNEHAKLNDAIEKCDFLTIELQRIQLYKPDRSEPVKIIPYTMRTLSPIYGDSPIMNNSPAFECESSSSSSIQSGKSAILTPMPKSMDVETQTDTIDNIRVVMNADDNIDVPAVTDKHYNTHMKEMDVESCTFSHENSPCTSVHPEMSTISEINVIEDSHIKPMVPCIVGQPSSFIESTKPVPIRTSVIYLPAKNIPGTDVHTQTLDDIVQVIVQTTSICIQTDQKEVVHVYVETDIAETESDDDSLVDLEKHINMSREANITVETSSQTYTYTLQSTDASTDPMPQISENNERVNHDRSNSSANANLAKSANSSRSPTMSRKTYFRDIYGIDTNYPLIG
jgi:predicted  nucleic acid-binding Zn-ribbon protein